MVIHNSLPQLFKVIMAELTEDQEAIQKARQEASKADDNREKAWLRPEPQGDKQ